ncbi:hypothetical protein ASPWEDRAFT_166843 [Aspergillus wentii DTO 134E9]|uniref:Oxidoreductase-like domain-containing protein n=1 Tax=Aspergillus wentii DTO 134E9 TaxID=1073089 RepID=A0A1L9S0X5_ASPWE|nr:uncharacterized protein ASPWEDRAFT_166843 [Aspergillus wentii DTO 134E9]KAI9931209.1 hypothetical protein MW887_010870 [Aspergillus wentii]OJJ40783.1 hypothetical protein ASPWEDRAFT_166843 [Aspergillus wentii DTO 134E9]
MSIPTPLYEPAQVPRIKNAKRLTTTRTKQLLRAADRAYNDPPPPPALGDCCGSSCDPCVNDLWKEELACWRERWGDGAVEDKDKDKDANANADNKMDKGEEEEEKERRMPGSWEW